METLTPPRIVSVEKLGTRVLIIFSDGKAGMFSSAMLYCLLPRADAVYESESWSH